MNNFTQNNQNGDNVMNFGSQPRELNGSLENQLKELIAPKSKVRITAVMGDGEAFTFASKIKEYLSGQDYQVDGVDQAVYSNPVTGQIIENPKTEGDPFNIIIGNKE